MLYSSSRARPQVPFSFLPFLVPLLPCHSRLLLLLGRISSLTPARCSCRLHCYNALLMSPLHFGFLFSPWVDQIVFGLCPVLPGLLFLGGWPFCSPLHSGLCLVRQLFAVDHFVCLFGGLFVPLGVHCVRHLAVPIRFLLGHIFRRARGPRTPSDGFSSVRLELP